MRRSSSFPVVGRHDPSLSARIVRTVPLLYSAGADAATDRPAHVRAASGLVRFGNWLAVVQDDANFVALVDAMSGRAQAITLAAGEGGLRQFDDLRGNKRFKLDLEACVVVRDRGGEILLAFGSGSSPLRERIVVVREGEARTVAASAFYAGLRGAWEFSGSELNVEGAIEMNGDLRLFNRGNGAPVDGRLPVDATCDIGLTQLLDYLRLPDEAPPPTPSNILQYDLGKIDGLRLTFTDAAVHDGYIFFAAAAEDSPDATRDGRVAGSALGVFDPGPGERWTPLIGEDGAPFAGKVEGLLVRGPTSAWVLVDRDDPLRPSELCEVRLEGNWMID